MSKKNNDFVYAHHGTSETHEQETRALGMDPTKIIWNIPPPEGVKREYTNAKSYLGLCAKLSRAYLTHVIIIIILFAANLYRYLPEINAAIEYSKKEYMGPCHSLEILASQMANSPTKVVPVINKFVNGIAHGTISNIGTVLAFTVQIMGIVLKSLIMKFHALWRCLLFSMVNLSVGMVSEYAAEVGNFINNKLALLQNAVDKMLHEVNDEMKSLQNALNSAAGGVSTIINEAASFGASLGSLFGIVDQKTVTVTQRGVISFEPIEFPDVSKAIDGSSWKIPDSVLLTLSTLKERVPNLDDLLHQSVNDMIDKPLRALATTIKNSFKLLADSIPDLTPKLQPIDPANLTFCNKYLPQNKVDEAAAALENFIWYFIWGLLGLALLCVSVNMVAITLEHKIHTQRIRYANHIFEEVLKEEDDYFARTYLFLKAIEDPIRYQAATRLGKAAFQKKKYRNGLRWFLQYVGYKPGWYICLVGMLGLLFVYGQIWFFEYLRHADTYQSLMEVGQDLEQGLASSVHKVVNSAMTEKVISDMEESVAYLEDELNKVLFSQVELLINNVNETISGILINAEYTIKAVFGWIPGMSDVASDFLTCFFRANYARFYKYFEMMRESYQVVVPMLNREEIMQGLVTTEAEVAALVNRTLRTMLGPSSNAYWKIKLNELIDSYEHGLLSQVWQFQLLVVYGGSMFVFGFIGLVWIWALGSSQVRMYNKETDKMEKVGAKTISTYDPKMKPASEVIQKSRTLEGLDLDASVVSSTRWPLRNLSHATLRNVGSRKDLESSSNETISNDNKTQSETALTTYVANAEPLSSSTTSSRNPITAHLKRAPVIERTDIVDELAESWRSIRPLMAAVRNRELEMRQDDDDEEKEDDKTLKEALVEIWEDIKPPLARVYAAITSAMIRTATKLRYNGGALSRRCDGWGLTVRFKALKGSRFAQNVLKVMRMSCAIVSIVWAGTKDGVGHASEKIKSIIKRTKEPWPKRELNIRIPKIISRLYYRAYYKVRERLYRNGRSLGDEERAPEMTQVSQAPTKIISSGENQKLNSEQNPFEDPSERFHTPARKTDDTPSVPNPFEEAEEETDKDLNNSTEDELDITDLYKSTNPFMDPMDERLSEESHDDKRLTMSVFEGFFNKAQDSK